MQKKDLFAGSSSSSSSSANDSDDDVLAEQMAAAAARERRRDPHAYTPFDPNKKNKKKREIAPISSISKANGNILKSSSSSSDGDSDDDNDVDDDDKAVTVSMKGKKDVKHENNKKKNNKKSSSHDDDDANNNNNNNNNEEEEEEEEEGEVDGIRINKAYAAKYEEVKRKKELQQLTVKYGKKLRIAEVDDEEEDEEDEEDDGAVLLTEDKEMAFAKAFLAIRQAAAKVKKQQKEGKKSKSGDKDESDNHDNATDTDNGEDPLKAPTAVFFPPPEEQVRENTKVFEEAIVKKRQERKKFTLADEYRRGVVAEAAVEDEEEDGKHHPQGNRRIQPLSAKERELRDSFLKNIAESTETFDVQPVVPVQSRQEQQEASGNKESVAKRLLKGAFAIKEAEGSSSAEEDPNEAFLRDFFVEELWKPENNKKRKVPKKQNSSKTNNNDNNNNEDEEDEDDDEGSSTSEEIGNNYASLAQLAQDEEDERFYADAEVWEREYQQRAYRHQEEAAEHVQSFPRPIGEHAAGLLRKSVTSARKEARQRRLQRMEEMREQQVAELRRLKTLKRQEIEAQRALIASVAGIVKNSSKGSSSSGVGNDDGKRKKKKTGQNMGDEDDDEDEDAEVKRLMALWSEKDLEEDFDPKKFDKKMASIFDDAYYDEENVDEEEMAFFEDEQDGTGEGVKSEDDEAEKENDDEDDEPELFKATSLQEAMTMTAAKTKGEGKKTLNKQQPQSQPEEAGIGGDMFSDDPLALLYPSAAMRAAEEASFEGRRGEIERMIQQQQQHGVNKDSDENAGVLQQLKAELQQKEQEYLQLHHESTLDGGALKARFKYRSVDPEDFTLSVEEILARDDRQLNMLVPMNCYAAYLTAEANRRDRIRVMGRRGWKRGGNTEGVRMGNNNNKNNKNSGSSPIGVSSGGVRVLDSGRRSRRYGDVQRTSLVDPTMSEEAGREWAAAVQGGLRQLRAKLDDNDIDNTINNNNNNNNSDKKEVVGKQKQHRGNDENRHDKRIHAAGAVRDGNMKKKPRYEEGRGSGGRGRGRGRG